MLFCICHTCSCSGSRDTFTCSTPQSSRAQFRQTGAGTTGPVYWGGGFPGFVSLSCGWERLLSLLRLFRRCHNKETPPPTPKPLACSASCHSARPRRCRPWPGVEGWNSKLPRVWRRKRVEWKRRLRGESTPPPPPPFEAAFEAATMRSGTSARPEKGGQDAVAGSCLTKSHGG